MDYRDLEDVRWMPATYSSEEIIGVVKKDRGYPEKADLSGGGHFGVAKEEIACLQGTYQEKTPALLSS